MAKATRHAVAARNAAANAITALIGASGFLDIYDGTQPTNPDTALGAQNLLAHLALTADAFADAVSGVSTANAITEDASANASGTATWFSLTTSAGTRILDGTVGTSDANLILVTTAIVATQPVEVTALTYTFPMESAA